MIGKASTGLAEVSEKQIEREEQKVEKLDREENVIDARLDKIEKQLDTELDSELESEMDAVKPEQIIEERPSTIPAKSLHRTVVREKNPEVTPYQLFVQQVPEWTKKPFMYIIPKNERMKDSWLEKWGDLVLLYCRTTITHVIALEELRAFEPFTNESHGKKISLEQMQFLIDSLIRKELAKWLDESKLRARIYYKTLEEFAEMLIKYIFDRGLDTEYLITLKELRGFEQEWSSLPDEDLNELMRILEKQKKVKPMDKQREAFSFNL